MAYLDTHLHLIDRTRFGYAWADGIPALANGDFSEADYRALTGDRVAGALFMEVAVNDADYPAEAHHFSALARTRTQGIAGVIASCRPETDARFEAWLDTCSGLGVRGFRRVLHTEPDDLSQSETFRANLRRLGARGFTFDICVLARQLPVARDLVAACPDQSFILDHCGVPDIAGGAFDGWAAGIDALAAYPNVTCKLSGLTAYCAPGTASADTLRPWVDHVLHRFGPARMVWGSDWPVVNLGSGLPDWLDISDALLAPLSTDEADAIRHATARRVYLGETGG